MLQPYGGGGGGGGVADRGAAGGREQQLLSCYAEEGAAAAAELGDSSTPAYLLVNGKMLRELLDEHVRLIGTFVNFEDSQNSRVVVTTPDGTRVCCQLAHAHQPEEGEVEKVVVVCGRVSSTNPPTLSDAFFLSMGNELDVEQANEVLATAHHSVFVSAFYPSRAASEGMEGAAEAAATGRDTALPL